MFFYLVFVQKKHKAATFALTAVTLAFFFLIVLDTFYHFFSSSTRRQSNY
jgi:hypothetical protein